MGFIRAGELDRRIEILRAGTGSDDGYTTRHGADGVWATVWAKVRPAPGIERFASGENAATAPTRFIIRWTANLGGESPGVERLNAKDKVRYPIGGTVHDIKSVNDLGRREGLDILAVARAD
jgi:head-tail adaptor